MAKQTTGSAMRGGAPWSLSGNSRTTYGHAYDRMTWFESPGEYMRFVGFADDILPLRHKGWFTSEFQDETLRGVVYQLPTHKGQLQFMYGFADPNIEGSAALSLELAHDKEDAARFADRVAEIAAEKERDYNEAWQAGSEWRDLGDTIAATRRACLALLKDAKAACDKLTDYHAIRATIRHQVQSYLSDIRNARDKREALFTSYGSHDGFAE